MLPRPPHTCLRHIDIPSWGVPFPLVEEIMNLVPPYPEVKSANEQRL